MFTFKVHAAKVEEADEGSTEEESEEEGRVEEIDGGDGVLLCRLQGIRSPPVLVL